MKTAAMFGALLLGATIFSGCGSTVLDSVWKDPNYASGNLDNFLVLAVGENETNRRLYESAVVTDLTARGVRGTPAYSVLPTGQEVTKEVLRPIVAEGGFDGILVTRLLGVDTDTRYVPGVSAVVPSYYHDFYGYHSRFVVVTEPGHYTEDTTILVETNLYETTDARLIWSGVSDTYNPLDVSTAIHEISKLIVDRLQKDGLVAE